MKFFIPLHVYMPTDTMFGALLTILNVTNK